VSSILQTDDVSAFPDLTEENLKPRYQKFIGMLERCYKERIATLRVGLSDLFQGFSEDEVLETLLADEETKEFAN